MELKMAKESIAIDKPNNPWRPTITAKDAIAAPERRHYRSLVFQGYMILAIVVFLILAVLAHTVAYFTFDVTITRAVQTINAGWFDGLMYSLSWIGFPP